MSKRFVALAAMKACSADEISAPESAAMGRLDVGLRALRLAGRTTRSAGKLSHYFDRQVPVWQVLGFQSPDRNTRRTLPSEYTPIVQRSASSQFRELGVFNAEMTALLRAVLEEVCENIPVSETGARAYVASKLLDAAAHGQLSTDALKAAGLKALNPPTM
ncbi:MULTISPECIES: hypothetical protein [Bradyrhizobium]|jgi:hypothetical protein|uniref:hypothetical protein n=1 Tax=Bradyrhizobium TaxID=374 RepID=UPI000456FE18